MLKINIFILNSIPTDHFAVVANMFEKSQKNLRKISGTELHVPFFLVLSNATQNRTLFFTTRSFGNQNRSSISKISSSACTVLPSLHFLTTYCRRSALLSEAPDTSTTSVLLHRMSWEGHGGECSGADRARVGHCPARAWRPHCRRPVNVRE